MVLTANELIAGTTEQAALQRLKGDCEEKSSPRPSVGWTTTVEVRHFYLLVYMHDRQAAA